MIRTATIAFPITLVLTWVAYVINRAGNGPGLQWSRVPGDAKVTMALVGVPYLIFVAIALATLYVTSIRGTTVDTWSVISPALVRFALVFVVSLVAAVPAGELYCIADERSFANETAAHLKYAMPDSATGELPLYSRPRWWPAGGQLLVSNPSSNPSSNSDASRK